MGNAQILTRLFQWCFPYLKTFLILEPRELLRLLLLLLLLLEEGNKFEEKICQLWERLTVEPMSWRIVSWNWNFSSCYCCSCQTWGYVVRFDILTGSDFVINHDFDHSFFILVLEGAILVNSHTLRIFSHTSPLPADQQGP